LFVIEDFPASSVKSGSEGYVVAVFEPQNIAGRIPRFDNTLSDFTSMNEPFPFDDQ